MVCGGGYLIKKYTLFAIADAAIAIAIAVLVEVNRTQALKGGYAWGLITAIVLFIFFPRDLSRAKIERIDAFSKKIKDKIQGADDEP